MSRAAAFSVVIAVAFALVQASPAAKLVASCSVSSPVVAGQPFTITASSTRYPFKLMIQEPQSTNTGYVVGPFDASPVSVQWTTYATGTGTVTVWVYGNSGHLEQPASCSFDVVPAAT